MYGVDKGSSSDTGERRKKRTLELRLHSGMACFRMITEVNTAADQAENRAEQNNRLWLGRRCNVRGAVRLKNRATVGRGNPVWLVCGPLVQEFYDIGGIRNLAANVLEGTHIRIGRALKCLRSEVELVDKKNLSRPDLSRS
jgi:hypothetical protein